MSLSTATERVDTEPAEPPADGRPRRFGTNSRFLAPVIMFAVVAIGACLPLIGNHIFYFWDDTAGVGVPVWHRIADAYLHGHIPLLNLDMWRGGDFSAEGATGMWNPLVVAVAIATYPIDNLAVGIAVGKIFFMLIMAGGSYLLARNYGIRRSLAAVIGAMLPFAGYSFFMDSTAWVNALMTTALIPWVWWTARLTRQGRSAFWLVITGYLACSLGNPYSLLAVGLLILAMMVEAWFTGVRRRAVAMAVAGLSVLLLNVMVFLPLLLSESVGYRAGSGTFNDGFLKPSLTNLLEMSSPNVQPEITNFGSSFLTVPAVYLAWFVLPMLPWLKWRLLREQWRPYIGLYVFGLMYLMLMLGPSQIWLFRWPLRLIDYFWFPVAIIWGLLVNQGLHTTYRRRRVLASVAIIMFGAWLAWGERPNHKFEELIGTAVVLGLVALLIRFGINSRSGFAVLMVGILVVLGLQVHWFPGNYNVIDYQFPNSTKQLKAQFAKYQGVTVQIANMSDFAGSDLLPDRAYKDVLFGSEYSVAGVESPTAYSGIGYTKMDNALCMIYQGTTTCPQAWQTLWQRPADYSAPFADLMRAQTIVVQNALIDTRNAPPPTGWHRSPADEQTGLVTVYKRDAPLQWPGGRLSDVTDGVQVTADSMNGTTEETLSYQRTGDGPASLTFARLDWPGYTATVNGQAATVRNGPAGLVVVDLPAGVGNGQVQLSWSPPGTNVSIVAAILGGLLAIGLIVAPWLSRRRRRDQSDITPAEGELTA
ncbi:MAG TPA: hypothetical protein VH352_20965 [Pseudonocardiaceae bacterium]|jgi:hypothetical protein|nr:hypothetical protein [Pseudonocardiaceae bacterium]